MSDSSEIDQAVVAALLGDAALTALMPGGVYVDLAPAGQTRFVIVSLVDHADVACFGGRAYEDALYLVKAVELSTAGNHTKAAAQAIDRILDDRPLAIPGYGWMATFRETRVRYVEPDATDSSNRWSHRGGHYRVQAALGAAPVAGDPPAGWASAAWAQPGWMQGATAAPQWANGAWMRPEWIQL